MREIEWYITNLWQDILASTAPHCTSALPILVYLPVSLNRTSHAMNIIATTTTTVAKKHTRVPELLLNGTYQKVIKISMRHYYRNIEKFLKMS